MSPAVPPFGRFTGPAVGVLASLAAGPRDVGAIAVDLESMTGGRVGPATLLGSLARLQRHGLVTQLDTSGPRRYRLTELGAALLPAHRVPAGPAALAMPVRLAEVIR